MCVLSFLQFLVCFSPGYSLCLGKSYLFRFNHPEEASRMKSMLPQKSPVSALAYNTGTHKQRRSGKPLLWPLNCSWSLSFCLCSSSPPLFCQLPSPLPPPSLFNLLFAWAQWIYVLLFSHGDLKVKVQVDVTQTAMWDLGGSLKVCEVRVGAGLSFILLRCRKLVRHTH